LISTAWFAVIKAHFTRNLHSSADLALVLLRARRERPCGLCSAEKRYELAPLYPNHVIPRACAVWVHLKRTLAALAHFARCLGPHRRPFAASGGRRDDRLSGSGYSKNPVPGSHPSEDAAAEDT
jgi:hypothetical protein